jgi:hypothetical protein
MTKITKRIERELGVPNLAKLLGKDLDPSDLQSLLVEVYRNVVNRGNPKALLSNYRSNRFTSASNCNPSRLLEWDRIALSNLPEGFRALELSPVSPLGTISLLAPISQDWILTTIRNVEVSSDPTNMLALECALRRQELNRDPSTRMEQVNLAASQRVVRSQRYEIPEARAHFRLFSLCSAGRDLGSLRFEVNAIYRHAGFYLKCLRLFLGPKVPLRMSIFDLRQNDSSRTKNLSALNGLQHEFRNVKIELHKSPDEGKRYYRKLRFHISGMSNRGKDVEVVDGGDTDWTQRLLANAKERLVISGIGTERLCEHFEPLFLKQQERARTEEG